MRDLIGHTLGHFRIVEKIGEGGMGEVYRAHDDRLDRDVAIKVLPEAVAADEVRLARFRREAKAVAALSHSSILEIFSFDTDGDVTYAVTELLEGQTLAEHLDGASDRLPLIRVHQIAAAVADGLAAAHGKGVIHRDVKPSNIFLCADGRVKILDFGLARDVETASEDETKSPTLSYYTDPGAVMGTVGYMSPEQVRGEPADRRSDIFAFGCVLYEMHTGRRAFDQGSAAETMARILNDNPEPVRKLRDDAVPKLVDVVNRAMRKDPAERYQGSDELLADLDEARQQIVAPTIGLIGWIEKRRKFALACLAALIIAVVVATGITRHRQESQRIAAVISELLPAAQSGRFDEVYAELIRREVAIDEIGDTAFLNHLAGSLSIESDPAHAALTVERVVTGPELPRAEPEALGTTPIQDHALIAGEYLLRLTLEGRPPIEFLVNIEPGVSVVERRGFATADAPEMVRVEAGPSKSGETIPAFLIDRREVTNDEYFRFVAAGGYRDVSLWPETLLSNAEAVPRDEAVATFLDQTGLNGPRFWSNGRYQDGREEYPVVGVSWYEAAAYAQWVGKILPTFDQWWRAAVGDSGAVFPWGDDVRTIHLRANFGMRGPQAVGTMPLGLSPFGCYDMAGNVREWIAGAESAAGKRLAVGGSWKEPSYMFATSFAEPIDAGQRRDGIGFRCARQLVGE